MSINKMILTSLIAMGFVMTVHGQKDQVTGDNESVQNVIVTLFDGMREADSAKVSSAFRKDVTMYTSFTSKEGDLMVEKGKLESFLKAVGTPHDEIWDERIWNTKILIDGGIAQVWTDYAFYIGEQFSHCGVDAFHLVKEPSGQWKIVHLMDTRRKNDCKTNE
jgi:hypothetical protein